MNPFLVLPLLLPILTLSEARTVTGMPSTPSCTIPLLCVAVAVGAWRRRHVEALRTLDALVGAVGCCWLASTLPSPIREAAWFAAGSFVLGRISRFFTNASVVSMAALCVTIAHWLAPLLLLRIDAGGAAGRALAGILGFLGVDAALTVGGVSLPLGEGGALVTATDVGRTGLREGASLLAGAVVLAAMLPHGRRLRGFLYFLLVLVGAMGVRSLAQIVILLETHDTHTLADPWVRSLTLGAPLLLLSLMRSSESPGTVPGAKPVPRRATVLLAAGVVILVCSGFAPGPVRYESGRIAVDEGHSHWERIDLGLSRDVYGARSVYNFAEWMRGIEVRYGPVLRLRTKITDESLAGVAVLILKTPTEPFTREETRVIHRYVDRGGGLYLVGEHTNIFGINSMLRPVSRLFGIEFRADGVRELHAHGGHVTNGKGLPPHPLTVAMQPMRWMTSCTLKLSGSAKPVIWVNAGYADGADYSTFATHGNSQLSSEEMHAPLAVAACVESGKGRVFAFTDSTLFSNFSVFMPGVRELAFGGVEWLLQRERFAHWRILAGLIGVALLLGGFSISRGAVSRACAGCALGMAIGFTISTARADRLMQPFRHQLDGKETIFDTTLSAGRLPLWHQTHAWYRDEFWAVFLAYQRSEALMRVAMKGDDPLAGAATIMIWPKKPLPDDYIARAADFVANGGRLYVFEDRVAAGSAANDIGRAFGVRFEARETWRTVPTDGITLVRGDLNLEVSAAVFGGETVLADEFGEPIVARRCMGRGVAVFAGVAQDFANHSIGGPDGPANRRAFDLTQMLYKIIDAGIVK